MYRLAGWSTASRQVAKHGTVQHLFVPLNFCANFRPEQKADIQMLIEILHSQNQQFFQGFPSALFFRLQILLQLTAISDRNQLTCASSSGAHRFHHFDNVHPLNNFTEHCVVAVEVWAWHECDEKLWSVRCWKIRERKNDGEKIAGKKMRVLRFFVGEKNGGKKKRTVGSSVCHTQKSWNSVFTKMGLIFEIF